MDAIPECVEKNKSHVKLRMSTLSPKYKHALTSVCVALHLIC